VISNAHSTLNQHILFNDNYEHILCLRC
jgi:hypothetical protein